jgi:hypothetical protein
MRDEFVRIDQAQMGSIQSGQAPASACGRHAASIIS